MIAAGIDVGGTKIEAQTFDKDWQAVDSRRVETPKTYPALVQAIADQIKWATQGQDLPVGIGAAGLIHPQTGLALTANLSASGKPWLEDISKLAGRGIPLINDCRAMTLSEAVFGAGRGHSTVMGFSIGTGIAGGLAQNGQLIKGQDRIGGEFGHMSLPAHIVARHNLPIVPCGCGRMGCFETLASGLGLARIAQHVMGQPFTAEQIVKSRDTDSKSAQVWQIWVELTAAMLSDLALAIDPDVIVLGGGVAYVRGAVRDVEHVLAEDHLKGFPLPPLVLAQGGAASCARGAAYHAWSLP